MSCPSLSLSQRPWALATLAPLALLITLSPAHAESIELEYNDAPLRAVVQSLADYADLGLIAGDRVRGQVNLQFSAESWRAALDQIAQAFELNYRIDRGILYVFKRAAPVQPAAEPEPELQLQTRSIALDYANSVDIAELLMQAKGADVAASRADLARGIWSERLFVAADERLNKLYLQGYEDELGLLEQLIPELDRPATQVSFSVHIVIAEEDVAREFGVRFGGQGSSNNLAIAGGDGGAFADASFADSLFVDFGVDSSSAPRLALGFNDANNLLNLELSALASESKVDIVSQPMVTSRDGGSALISTGTEVPYIVSTADSETVEFRSAVLSLQVKPRVSEAQQIIHLQIEVTQDAIGAEINNQPSIDTNRLVSDVSVANGQMSMLGGIKQSRRVSVQQEVPWWGQLPVIGWLFRYQSTIVEEGELLIFITPTIVTTASTELR